MELLINIKEQSKMAFILELLRSFDYIDIINIDEEENAISEAHKRLLDKRLKEIEEGKTTFKDWDDIRKKYEKKI
jgi:hypothetical protein